MGLSAIPPKLVVSKEGGQDVSASIEVRNVGHSWYIQMWLRPERHPVCSS